MHKLYKKMISFLAVVCCLAGSITTVSAAQNDGTAPRVTFTNEPNLSPDLRVTKTVQSAVEGYDVPEYAKFQFVLKLNGEIAAGEKYTLSDRNGEIIRKSGTKVIDFETDENGVFTLENGQTATFEYVGNNVPYEVTERSNYLCPIKGENDEFQSDSTGYVLYQKDGNGEDVLLHPEYKYQLRAMEKDGYALVSPLGGDSGNVVPDMETVKFVNQYTPTDITGTELKVTKNVNFPEEYEMPEAIKNTMFWFHLEIEDNAAREYTVLNPINEWVETVRFTDTDGDFCLYPGETAVFANVPAEGGYRIEEIMTEAPPIEIPPIEILPVEPPEEGDDLIEMMNAEDDSAEMMSRGMISGGIISGGNRPILRPVAKYWPEGWWPAGDIVKEGTKIPASPIVFQNANASFRVRKTMDDKSEPEGVEFTFQLVDAQNNPVAGATYYRYNFTTKELVSSQGNMGGGGGILLQAMRPIQREEWTTDENGYFHLAPGEEVIFCGIEPGTSYTIKEIGRLIEVDGEMKVDPSYAEQPSQSGTVSATGQLSMQNFVNSRIDVAGTLTVTKQVENAGQEGSGTADEFHFLLYKRLVTLTDVRNELLKLAKEDSSLAEALGGTEAIESADNNGLNEKVAVVLVSENGKYGWKAIVPEIPDMADAPEMLSSDPENDWHYGSNGRELEIYIPVTGAVYNIVTGDIVENYATGPDAESGWGAGEFSIKAGQTARFGTLSVGGQYRVEEVGFTAEYMPKSAAGFSQDSTSDQTQSLLIGGTVQTVTRKADGRYEYTQTAEMPQEGLAFTFTNLYKPKKVDIQIQKVDDKEAPLQGAEFMLYLNKGKENKVLPEGAEDTYRYTVNEEGMVKIENLKPGTYWLYEEKAPSGYRILTEPVEIEILQTQTGLEIKVDGTLCAVDITSELDGSGVSKVTILANRGTDTATGEELNDELQLTIPNIYLYELPNSGGIGIYWYSIGGMLLMMAAALILYRYKHMGEVLKD